MSTISTLMFKPSIIPEGCDAFTGVFIMQNSYKELLALVDSYFSLNMLSADRKIPCAKHSYMLISKSTEYNKLWYNVGKRASLTINKLVYDEQYGVVIALVYLNNNFTCNRISHIVLAKNNNINRATVNSIINNPSSTSYVVQLDQPFKAHGCIGVLSGSGEESDLSVMSGGIHKTPNIVARPETTLSVENPDPDQNNVLSIEEYKLKQDTIHLQPCINPTSEDNMKITLDASQEAIPTMEIYKGCNVMKGPRGGKFIIKDGKKIYCNVVADDTKKSTSGSAVYKISMLSS